MNLKYIYTRLHVENYLDCQHFYQDILGLKVSMTNYAQEYVEFDAGETKITLLDRSRLKDYIDSILVPRGSANVSATYDRHDAKMLLTFAVPDLDDTILQLTAKGVGIFSSPWQHPEEGLAGGMLSACIRDPDGNIIELEQILS